MKNYKHLITAIALSLSFGACTTKSPPVAFAPPTPATAPLAAAPATVTPSIPAWYLKLPESTPEAIYLAGTALSRDMAMSNQKAQLDAETQLANKIAGEINTLTKDYKRDAGDEYVQSSEIVSKKIATDVKVIGGIEVDHQVFAEGGGYRTYILLKFPLGSNNLMLQNYLNIKNLKGSQGAAETELQQTIIGQRERDE